MKIKTGDLVRVRTGKDKGKEGKVLQVFTSLNRVVVEGVNIMKKQLRKQSNRPGQIISFPGPLNVSNVSLVSPKSGKSGRIGMKLIQQDGRMTKVRVIRYQKQAEDIELLCR